MAIKNKSVSAIAGPEFVNLEPLDINPLMSKCGIKVFYLGQNRNGSYINKETATEMAKTLRGTPIVAAWSAKNKDYGDHFGNIDISSDGNVVQFQHTIPLGFVAPDSDVWFQNFVDTDEFGNKVERTYLLTEGYLWTTQFKEELDKLVEDGGQPQSMELDEETLNGHWAFDDNVNMEFFIIDDAVFSKLCILGDNVEPCFEGAAVTTFSSQEVTESSEFTLENTPLSKTLFTMMNELKDTLLNTEGGLSMPEDKKDVFEAEEQAEEVEVEAEEAIAEDAEAEVEAEEDEEATDAPEGSEEEAPEQPETLEGETEEEPVEEPVEDKDETEEPAIEFAEESEEEEAVEETEEPTEETAEPDVTEFAAMQEELNELRTELESLREYRASIENSRKDALINHYYMLSDEDKQDIIEHKADYSYEEIEAKLALLYVKKNVDFSHQMEDETASDEEINFAFSLNENKNEGVVSPICEALRRTKKN